MNRSLRVRRPVTAFETSYRARRETLTDDRVARAPSSASSSAPSNSDSQDSMTAQREDDRRSKAVKQAKTIGELFNSAVAHYADEPALRTADGTVAWTWNEYGHMANVAAGAISRLGTHRGDTIGCWLTNRPEFHAVDMGAALIGIASFSVYPTYTVEQAAHALRDAGSRILITEPVFLERALAVRAAGDTALETIVCLDEPYETTMTWRDFLAHANGVDMDRLSRAVTADDLLTIIYTSGTTGPPKGVELTHHNVLSQMDAIDISLRLHDRMRAISYLPMAHVAERLVTHYQPIMRGWRVTTCADARNVAALLPEVRPELFFSPPRMWEKLRAATLAQFDGDESRAAAAKSTVLSGLGLDAVDVALVGSGPCPPQVIHFWHALGLRLSEVYGMSETTAVATVSPPDAIKVGTCGTPIPGVQVALSATGEILIRGPVVMSGYRHQPEKTSETIDNDGWLHTGDLGVIDDAGYLRVVDRIKEIIINAAGKNMSPINIEATLKSASPLIAVAVCIGEGRPYNTALITLDPALSVGRSRDPAVIETVQAAVDEANKQLSRVEQIKRFRVIDGEWLPGGDELTPTSKLKRRAITAKYAHQIEEMYSRPENRRLGAVATE